MLKRVIFRNLGFFNPDRPVCIDTHKPDGKHLAIFIGENGSGKSSVSEFIRRCLSDEITKSESNRCDESQPGFAKCEFDFGSGTLKGLEDLRALSKKVPCAGVDLHKAISDLTSEKPNRNLTVQAMKIYTKDKDKHYKFLYFDYGEETGRSILMIQRTISPEVKDYAVTAEADQMKRMKDMLVELEDDSTNTKLEELDIVMQKLEDMLEQNIEQYEFCRYKENFVKAVYSNLFGKWGKVFFLFAHRGIGPLMSSISQKMSRGRLNYEDTVSNAETMSSVLEEFNKEENSNLIEKSKNLAWDILGSKNYEIKRVSTTQVVLINRTSGKQLDLLKVPEGVYEAYIVALILTLPEKSEYMTLILDEPNKCMHPAQIERLQRALLKVTEEKKVSIVCTTHSRDLISLETWYKLYLFRKESEKLYCYRVCETENKDIGYLFSRPSKPYRDILFSNKCLFVEGESDYRFLKQLLHETEVGEEMKSMTLVSMEGADNLANMSEFCSRLGIPHFVCVDQNRKDKKDKVKPPGKFYFWKNGNIEDIINNALGEEKTHLKVTKKQLQIKGCDGLKELVEAVKDAEDFKEFISELTNHFCNPGNS